MHYLGHLAEFGTTDLHPSGAAATELLMDALALEAGQRVLEIGCGAGATMVRVASTNAVSICGVDILDEMLRVSKMRLWLTGLAKQASIFRACATDLPFKCESFDRVYMESVLGFQSADVAQRILSEAFRVLKTPGLLVANEATWKSATPAKIVAQVHLTSHSDFGLCQACQQGWDVDDWRLLMRSIGFRVKAADVLDSRVCHSRSSFGELMCWRGTVSRLLTRYYAIRGSLLPSLRRQRSCYRKRLQRHLEDGNHIEARLFVLATP